MAKTDYKTIDDYHKVFSGEVLERMQTIRELVHKIAPNAEEVISYQIPAFKIGDKFPFIFYSAYSKHITLSYPWSEAFIKELEVDLKGYKISKSAIQLPLDKPFQIDLVKKILKFRKAEFEANRK